MTWRALLSYGPTSGPGVARVFHRLLGLIAFAAWASLAVQVETLIGSRGLLPVADLAPWPALPLLPSLFRWIPPQDGILIGGAYLGAALGLIAASGVAPRVLAGIQVVLYLSYATACRDFLAFQWDNLFLEAALLATLLPRDRPAPLVHFLFRVLLFKLYFESGIAKWQSHLHDWHDGSAMTVYYETAPLPTLLAWWAHHLPVWWHHFESRATLFVELAVPLLIFAPRRFRLAAFVIFTGFQLANLLTANYGFFVYLALVLHVFLLNDRAAFAPRPTPRWKHLALIPVVAVYVGLSTVEGVVTFADPNDTVAQTTRLLRRLYAPLRVINTYHLFGHITRDRIEPEFLTSLDGKTFIAHPLNWKPGPSDRAPPFVAPHQPRVDFLLWFYGLAYDRGAPEYVATLMRRICFDPRAVQSLFATPLPYQPAYVQIRFGDYRFSSPAEKEAGRWWHVEPRGGTRPVPCKDLRSGALRAPWRVAQVGSRRFAPPDWPRL